MRDATRLGGPMDRVDGVAKVTGAARYAADQPPPAGLTHAVLVTSTVARGRITGIDDRTALAVPGVVAVLTHENAPRLVAPPDPPWPDGQSFLPLQGPTVHMGGQIVAYVVAETVEQAREAAALVTVEYTAEPPAVSLVDNLADAFRPEPGGWVTYEYRRGDPAAALAAAPVRVDAELTTPMAHHNPIEPSTTTAVWDGADLTLYESTQAALWTRARTAAAIGVAQERIRVVSPFLGGGFGSKGYIWPHTYLTAAIARQLGRPVKLVLTRAQAYTLHGHRAESAQTVRLGAGRDGRLTAIAHAGIHQTSPFDDISWEEIDISSVLYRCPNVDLDRRLVRLNLGNPTPMRAPAGIGGIALESALDELAYATGIDPIELRRRNYADSNQEEHGNPSWHGAKFLDECYRLGADLFGWRTNRHRPGTVRRDGAWLGTGMATAFHAVYRTEAQLSLTLDQDGRCVLRSAAHDIGTGTYTVVTQVAAEALGLPADRIRCELGDTNLPPGPPSAGSRTAASLGAAARDAGHQARDQLIVIAVGDPRSPLHGLPAARVAAADGLLFDRTDPRRADPHTSVLKRHGRPVEVLGTLAGDAVKSYSYGAVFAEVRVDERTGEVRVTRFAGAFDVGRVLNEKTARGQALGGMVWGLGAALTEHTLVDRNLGRVVTPNLAGYLIPVQADVPDIDVTFVDRPDPTAGELGARGMGELSANGAAAAIVNAVFHATGRRARHLPITPDTTL